MPTLSPFRPLAALALLLPLAPAAAFAAAAAATQTVNVRSGPATSFGVVAQLQQGDTVDVRQCEGTFCEVSFGGKDGWVSATYLTRDAVQKPALRTVPAEPQVAAATAPPTSRPQISPDQFPPAYDSNSNDDAQSLPPLSDTDAGSASADFATTDVPRPKADIPDAAFPQMDDPFSASTDDLPAADDGFVPLDRRDGWRMARHGLRPDRFQRFGRHGFRPGFAEFGASGSPARACFVETDGSPAFCVGEGDHVDDLAQWSDRPLMLHNPDALEVVVCTAVDNDCETYGDDRQVIFRDVSDIASVSVAAPGY